MHASGALLLLKLIQVTESISGSIVPLAMFGGGGGSFGVFFLLKMHPFVGQIWPCFSTAPKVEPLYKDQPPHIQTPPGTWRLRVSMFLRRNKSTEILNNWDISNIYGVRQEKMR